jgi:hypothetical protein
MSSASAAQPEFVLKAGKSFPIKLKETSGVVKLATEKNPELVCSATTSEALITAAMGISVSTIKFTGCEATVFGIKVACESAGAAAKEIRTKALIGKLDYTVASSKETGILLKAATGTEFATFKCSTVETKITGEVIGVFPAAALNKQVATAELNFTTEAGKAWKQVAQDFELLQGDPEPLNMVGVHIVAFGEEAGLAAKDVLTFEPASETVEIKA